MIIYWVQVGFAIFVFLFSTVAAWFEGSGILQDIFSWDHTTPFSQLLNGEVTKASDIVILDYFVFAAKYLPLFPILMTLSSLHLLILFGYFLFKNTKKFIIFLGVIGSMLIFLSIFFINYHTIGGKSFLYTFLVSGLLCIIITWIIKKYDTLT
ncbi:DUF4306 domain-containing protein [Oceanobacillus piezotolerans]|uniref:DUF4306 domain-containing protein n=1 Tax=Oceanobacillus piezotolerans TaxID=2448030 RepID=A0A498DUC3_9BACI|nr:DUF4306 domain-containing protein [Oceanobacillus piezotolerans]RLL48457.1 DUF4306 domain-containing protein [Oceanobacillus piezotolerans]